MLTHVSSWEELPEGDWLDNDEQGTNWYLDNDGNHWHSTEDGFVIWEEEKTDSHQSQVDVKTYDDEAYDDDVDEEDEEYTPKAPTPNIGVGTAIIGVLIALAVIGWTYGIAIPATDDNIGMLERNEFWSTESFVPEDQIWIDGLKTVQTLNTLTIVLAVIMVGTGTFSLLKKSPWWGLSAAHLSLTSILMFTVFTAFSAEKEWVEACNPQVVSCFQIPPPSLSVIDAFYPAIFSTIYLLIVVNNSFKSWAQFDPDEEQGESVDLFLLFIGQAPKLGVFPALVGLLMSLCVMMFTWFVSIPTTDENIGANDYGMYFPTEWITILESIQIYNYSALYLVCAVLVISILTAMKKVPWWMLPTSSLCLVVLLLLTAQKSTFDGTSLVVQDAFYSSCCSLIALAVIAISAARTMSDIDWEDFTDEDDSSTSSYRTGEMYNSDNEEVDEEWRAKVKTIVLSSMLLIAGLGGFAMYQYATDDPNSGPDFQIRNAVGNITNESNNSLVVVDLLDKTASYQAYFIEIKIQINGGEEIECGSNKQCDFDIWSGDGWWTAQESTLIYENGQQDICSGQLDSACEVTVTVAYDYDEAEDYSGPEVLAVLTINAVSEQPASE